MRESGLGPGPSLAHSPSLNGRSSGTLAEIAARVVNEFAHYHHHNDVVSYSSATNDAFPQPEPHHLLHRNGAVGFETEPQSFEPQKENDLVDYHSDFEFAVPGIGENPSPISADEIFLNGQIKPLFPVFGTGSVLPQAHSPVPEENPNPKSPARNPMIRMPLKKLMISERETSLTESFSCSSYEADELEGVAPGTYCVWNPNKNEMKKKIKSAGSSKRWNFRDLLHRSHSYGGDELVVLASKSKSDITKPQANSAEKNSSGDGRKKKKAIGESGRNRRTAYLVGMLTNINGLSRAVQPF